MKWIKWILGILLAGIITIWPANLIMHHTGKVDMDNLNAFQYWVKFLTVPALAFGSFLFLACVFVPVQKKYAGITVFVLNIVFFGMGAYQHYSDDGVLKSVYLLRYICFTAFSIIAFMAAYKMYKNRHWTEG